MNEWTTVPPSTEGYYWYREPVGEIGLIEVCGHEGVFVNGETSEPVESMAKNFPVTHWCGPLIAPSIQINKIDYKRLLVKYMAHVEACESVTFTDDLDRHPDAPLTDAEWAELKKISAVIDNENQSED